VIDVLASEGRSRPQRFAHVLTEPVLDPTSVELEDLIYMFSPVRVLMG
jgi:hypothetical protein